MSLTVLAASKIAEIAFNEFVKAGAGELAKKTFTEVADLVSRLRQRILTKFKGNSQAEAALVEVEQQGDQASLEKVTQHLDAEMQLDGEFASEIQQIAQQIIHYQGISLSKTEQQYNNYGRDQNVIHQPQGNIKIGGS